MVKISLFAGGERETEFSRPVGEVLAYLRKGCVAQWRALWRQIFAQGDTMSFKGRIELPVIRAVVIGDDDYRWVYING